MKPPFSWPEMDGWILGALKEDVGAGDVTTEAVVDPAAVAGMEWLAKSRLVVCGLFVAERVFTLLDPEIKVVRNADEGSLAEPGQLVLKLRGRAQALLAGERVALNIVQHLSGIATLTKSYLEAAAGTRAKIAATRKTTPFLRRLEKYAVVTAGGVPHRFGLDDGVLIKDNHVALAGSVREAVLRARAKAHHLLRIEVEVGSVREAKEAMETGAHALLLDNMELSEMRQVVELARGQLLLEASGNIGPDRVAEIAATGVDIISAGALTHSAPAADISARIITDER